MREVPKCAKSQNARSPKRRMTADGATFVRAFSTSRPSTPYGTSRRMGLRAVWDSALYGTSRTMGLRALWDLAPFRTLRPSGTANSLGSLLSCTFVTPYYYQRSDLITVAEAKQPLNGRPLCRSKLLLSLTRPGAIHAPGPPPR